MSLEQILAMGTSLCRRGYRGKARLTQMAGLIKDAPDRLGMAQPPYVVVGYISRSLPFPNLSYFSISWAILALPLKSSFLKALMHI